MKIQYGKIHYHNLYGMIKDYLTTGKTPDMIPDGKARFPGEDAMSRPTLRHFMDTMKAFRYNAVTNQVVILDYGVSRAEKARVYDHEIGAFVIKPIKNPLRQIGTLRQYVVVPESQWNQYLGKVFGDCQKNSYRTSFAVTVRSDMMWLQAAATPCFIISYKTSWEFLERQLLTFFATRSTNR